MSETFYCAVQPGLPAPWSFAIGSASVTRMRCRSTDRHWRCRLIHFAKATSDASK
jgi:hypothetical protein